MMTRHYITIILTFLTLTSVSGQAKKVLCDCPKTEYAGTKADTAFHFPNKKTIVLCGSKNSESPAITYSEFILAVCGQGTIIDFWDAVLTCRLKAFKDTLFVEQLVNLPNGKNFKYQENIWLTDKIYFDGQKVLKRLVVNKQIKRYNLTEVKAVLKTFELEKAGLDDNKMVLANKLFIGTISGDKTARKYFKEFKNKFGILDGAFAEEYSDLVAMLELWDEKK